MTENMTADIKILGIHTPTGIGEDYKFIIYYRGKNRDSEKNIAGMLYIDPNEMKKFHDYNSMQIEEDLSSEHVPSLVAAYVKKHPITKSV